MPREHLYRRHVAPVQCVRCWLFFKSQEHLNLQIAATKICERRDGEAAEGVTPTTERRLRSRKKLSMKQTDDDRWRDIYRLLFPGVIDEDIPSPCKALGFQKVSWLLIFLVYGTVQDDAAQASVSLDVPIEEFMRQEVPQFFTSRLQTEINSMDLENTGLLDDPTRLRKTFIARMTSLISDAQDAAVEAYRQKSSENSLQLNQLVTPGPSSSSGSCPNASQDSGYASSRREDVFRSQNQPGALSWTDDHQPIDEVATNDARKDYLNTQGTQESGHTHLDSRIDSQADGSNAQLTKEDVHRSLGLENNNLLVSQGTQILQHDQKLNGSSLDLDWAAWDSYVNEANWLTQDLN